MSCMFSSGGQLMFVFMHGFSAPESPLLGFVGRGMVMEDRAVDGAKKITQKSEWCVLCVPQWVCTVMDVCKMCIIM